MEKLTRSQNVGLFALIIVMLAFVAVGVVKTATRQTTSGIKLTEAAAPVPHIPAASSAHSPDEPAATQDPIPHEPVAEVVVHVAGAVKKPGVYHLKFDARNEDALNAAGGATADANTDGVNLAAHVQDGTQLYVPSRAQQPTGGASAATTSNTAGKSDAAAASHSGLTKATAGGKSAKLTNPNQGMINLNTANAEQLQRVPGIGPAMAERIIEFRQQNGGFKSPEDLLQMSGIGDKKFEKMKPFVKVR